MTHIKSRYDPVLIDYRKKIAVQGQNTKHMGAGDLILLEDRKQNERRGVTGPGHKDRLVIDPAFEKLARSIGMGLYSQRNYLPEYHHLHPRTREVSYGYDHTYMSIQ